jgi:hypothetical protein
MVAAEFDLRRLYKKEFPERLGKKMNYTVVGNKKILGASWDCTTAGTQVDYVL